MSLSNFFKRIKKENKEINQNEKTQQINAAFEQFKKDREFLRTNFYDYDIDETDRYNFIYRRLKDLKKTLIICSLIKEVDIPFDAIKEVYGIDDEYINNVIDEEFPSIKAEAYKYLRDVAPNVRNLFFPDVKTHQVEIYKEFTERMDFITEIRRNGNKISKELGNNRIAELLKENIPLLELLNYFDVKESLNIASNLNLLDPLEDEIVQDIYTFDDDEFKELLGSKRMKYLEDDLKNKINTFGLFTRQDLASFNCLYINYEDLIETYTDMTERINQTKDYVLYNNKVKQIKIDTI